MLSTPCAGLGTDHDQGWPMTHHTLCPKYPKPRAACAVMWGEHNTRVPAGVSCRQRRWRQAKLWRRDWGCAVSKTADVLVIGGGVIGCAIAYALSKAGARVTLVERLRIGEEASWATAGLISLPRSTDMPLERARLFARSHQLYPALVAEVQEATGLSVEYSRAGELAVASDEREAAALRAALPWQHDLGFSVEWLDGDETRRREPALGPALQGATWCASIASVRGHRLTRALARAAQLRGATLLEAMPVHSLLSAGERVTGARTAQGDVQAGTTVLAAGAWSGELAAGIGLAAPTRPVRGQMLALDGAEPPLRHIIAGAGGYLIPRADGTIAVAATVEEAGFDKRVTTAGLAWLASLVQTLAPALTSARVIATWAGLRPGSSDDVPIMGRAPGRDGLWIATGHFRNGILWAPVAAELLSNSIMAGQPDAALAPYDPTRFGN
ncbi:MAG: glycine oxidase ThiO [Thermomicrobiales bacterium]